MINAPACPDPVLSAVALIPAHPLRSARALEAMTDERLVELALLGQPLAFDVLTTRHYHTFLRQAARLVRTQDEAQDVVQAALLSMFTKLHTFDLGSNFRSWAYRVVMNAGLMRLRKRRHRREVCLEAALDASSSSSSSSATGAAPSDALDGLLRQELRERLAQAAQELPQIYRDIFFMREADHLSLHEIGHALDLSIPAVKSRLHRARQHMRSSLEGYTGPSA